MFFEGIKVNAICPGHCATSMNNYQGALPPSEVCELLSSFYSALAFLLFFLSFVLLSIKNLQVKCSAIHSNIQGAKVAVEIALIGDDGPTGRCFRIIDGIRETVPW